MLFPLNPVPNSTLSSLMKRGSDTKDVENKALLWLFASQALEKENSIATVSRFDVRSFSHIRF